MSASLRHGSSTGEHSCLKSFFEFQLVSQRDPVIFAHEAEAAALVKAQRIYIVVGGNELQAGAAVPHRQLLGRFDQGGSRPAPLPVCVKRQDLTPLPVRLRQVREYSQQVPIGIVGNKRRIVPGIDQVPQTSHAGALVPDQERLGSWHIGSLSRTDLHPASLGPGHESLPQHGPSRAPCFRAERGQRWESPMQVRHHRRTADEYAT